MMSWIENFYDNLKLAIPEHAVFFGQDVINQDRKLIFIADQLIIHPISIPPNYKADAAIQLQQFYVEKGVRLIHLWEDIWQSQKSLVMSRIMMNLGLHTKIYARNTLVQMSSKLEAKTFFNQHHQLGYINQRYNYALRYEGDILAMAAFGDIRAMPSKGESYFSAELSRFACAQGYSVPGALSKLVHSFLSDHQVNDMMSYADRDWTLGKSYQTVGFELTAVQPPQRIYYHTESQNRVFPHRLPKSIQKSLLHLTEEEAETRLSALGYVAIFNTGNLKYHLHVSSS